MSKKKVLILCTGNSCRSQMAEGIVNHYFSDTWQAFSAGTRPSTVNPIAIEVMKEIGIDLSKNTSKSLNEFLGQPFDLIITVCDDAKENCPFFPSNAKRYHFNFHHPAKATTTKAWSVKTSQNHSLTFVVLTTVLAKVFSGSFEDSHAYQTF
jgi:arsenate reductase